MAGFSVKKPLTVFVAVLGLTYGLAGLPLLRWGLGAALGLWELLRIRKRKALI